MILCSQCGKEKLFTNGWYLFWGERFGERCCFTSFDLDPAMQREATVQKLCGMDCLHRAIQKAAERLRISA
jgi:hypothetical protein